jgi:membrane protein
MPKFSRANSPLWLDLLFMSGMVGAAYALDRYVITQKLGPRSRPEVDEGDKPDEGYTLDVAGMGSAETLPREPQPQAADAGTKDHVGAIKTRPSQEPESLQHQRSCDPGRGRRAQGPHQVPPKGWMDVGWRVYGQIGEDRLLAVAAGAVFYMLLALFPAVTALVSLYGLFNDPVTINEQLSLLSGVMPSAGIDIIREQVTRLTENSSRSLSFGFIVGLALALWSANAGMKAIMDALNVVYDEREKRGFVTLTLVAFAFTLSALVFIILALGAIVVLPLVLAWIGIDTQTGTILNWVRWPALLLITILGLSVLYRYGPSRESAQWRWLSVGAVFATVAWLLSSALFTWYLSNFANYDATYGSLGAGIGLMMWLWLTVCMVLIGGEINAELEHQTSEDTTTGAEKPLGRRGAVMADTVGEAWR